MNDGPYNPLDKLNLARSIEGALLATAPAQLGRLTDFEGAGVYAIYYSGQFEQYGPIRCDPGAGRFDHPIYVGKAIPKGGRKGGLTKDAGRGAALRSRLRQHASSIDEANNLSLDDFWARYLLVDDIWIPLGENVLIESFMPVWNRAIDGFGNKDPGRRRATQYRSPWDVLHPGRTFATKLADSGVSETFLRKRVSDYFAGRPLEALPKGLAEQLAEETATIEAAADEAPI